LHDAPGAHHTQAVLLAQQPDGLHGLALARELHGLGRDRRGGVGNLDPQAGSEQPDLLLQQRLTSSASVFLVLE
jgi:hypothetical protein